MSVLGWFIAVIGLVGVIYGVLQKMKASKMGSVPFRRPSEIAQLGPGAADAKGLISTEGQCIPGQPLYGPMSGRPCLAYEISIERKWEKSEQTEKGTETRKGSDKVFDQYQGAWCQVGDGMANVHVDATKKPDCDLTESARHNVQIGMMIPGVLQFGNMQYQTPHLPQDSRTTEFVGIERVLAPTGNVYVLGALTAGPQGVAIGEPPGVMGGRLIFSEKGREALLGATKRNTMLGFIIGGVLMVGGTGLGIFGPAPGPGSGCRDFSDATSCDGRMYNSTGIDYTWTVPAAANYRVQVTQPAVRYPIWARVTITSSTNAVVAQASGVGSGAVALVEQSFEPGTYHVNVRDVTGHTVRGGYGFHLEVQNLSAPAQGATGDGGAAAQNPTETPTTEPTGTDPNAAPGTDPGTPSPTAGGGNCARAARCCRVLSPTNTGCDNLVRLPDSACVSTLASYRRAVRVTQPRRLSECD